jgi:hypothetical protein
MASTPDAWHVALGPVRALLLIADRKPRAFFEAVQLARRARRTA